MKEKINKINNLFFIILPFIDIVTSLMTRLIDLPVSLGVIIKGLYTISIAVYILLYTKGKEKKHFIYYLIAILIYCLLFIITKPHLWDITNLMKEVVSLYKYLFTGFILFAYIVLYKNKESKDKITKVMFYTLICYTVLLIIPAITNTGFNSYTRKSNSGTVGWFYAANEISAIILMLFPFYFSKLKEKIENKKYIYLFLIVPIIYSIYIIGTKTSWYGLILMTLVIFIIYLIKERKNKKLVLFSLVVAIIPLLLNNISPTSSNVDSHIESIYTENTKKTTTKKVERDNKTTTKKQETTTKFAEIDTKEEIDANTDIAASNADKDFKKCGKFHKLKELIPNKKIYRAIFVVLSGRENKAYTELLIYKDTNLLNKLFGTGFVDSDLTNNCYIEKYIEIDLLDGFIHFGMIGLLILLFPYFYTIKYLKNIKIKKLDSTNLIYIFTFILLVGLSFVSGHILGYPTPSIYLNLLLILIINNIENK